MDRQAVLAAFDEQIRRHDEGAEHDRGVIRTVGDWNGVVWSELDDDCVDAVIAAQISRFEAVGPWEWKHYSYDRPPDLPERLLAAGFTREEPEALMVAELASLDLDVPPPAGVELAAVVDARGADALASVHDEVFGAGAGRPSSVGGIVAWAGETPVAAGRIEFHAGTDFASLWGDGTLAEWRGRGIFRALVAHRAALASTRGFRYLQVDAMPASGPIFERLGFVELAVTTPFVHP